MKKIFVVLLLFVAVSAFSQDRVSAWRGVVTHTGAWVTQKVVLGAIDSPSGTISVWDSTGGTIMVALSAADTADASNGLAKWVYISPGTVFEFPNRATRTVYVKAIGSSATVHIVKY